MNTQYETVIIERAEGIGTITLNRPEKRNAINLQMCLDLYAAVGEMDLDDDIRVVLIRGAGSTFCAGADVGERDGVTAAWVRQRRLKAFAAYDAIEGLAKPCIAVAQGAVIGGGGEIAGACDFVIASERASFRYPETVRGSVGAGQRLPRMVGKAMAKELLFTGRTIDAAEALRIRLVNRVVGHDQLEATVMDLAHTIKKNFPLSVQLMKRCIDVGMEADIRTGMAYERLAIDRCLAANEWREGVKQFMTERGAPQ